EYGGAGHGEGYGADGEEHAESDVDDALTDAAERLAHDPGDRLPAGQVEHHLLLTPGDSVVNPQQEAAHGERPDLGGGVLVREQVRDDPLAATGGYEQE